jgi:two-component system nitrate/nitrite response regulator NarL
MSGIVSSPIRIFLVDDHALFREGLVRLLEAEEGFQVAGTTATAREALELAPGASVDILLLDFDLGAECAVEFIAEVRRRGFQGQILIVTAGVSPPESVQLVRAGVAGIFHKHNPPETLCRCIRQIAAGEPWLESKYLKPLLRSVDASQELSRPAITDRERGVMRGVFQGLANKEIGERLQISESSVKSALQQLFQKMGVRTRSQLVRVALEQHRELL